MTETEPQEIPEGVDPETGEVTEPEPEPVTEPDEDEEAPDETPPELEAAPDSTSAEQEAAYHALDRKADNYLKGVVKIANGAALPLVQCELCADAYPGVRWGDPQNDQAKAMLSVIGAAGGESPLNDDPDALLCERCNGFGWTKLPSHVPNNTERMCRKCNGAGWLDTNPQSGSPQAPQPQSTNGETAPMPGVPEDDPAVIDLRARGFYVAPLPHFEASGQ